MNHAQANRMLDRLKDGEQFPITAINRALIMTGDLDEHIKGMDAGMRGEGLDSPLPQQNQRGGQARGEGLVGSDLPFYCQTSRGYGSSNVAGQNE